MKNDLDSNSTELRTTSLQPLALGDYHGQKLASRTEPIKLFTDVIYKFSL